MYRLLASLILLMAVFTAPAAERPAYTPEQLSLSRTVSECRLSPDGTTTAFVTDISGALELWSINTVGGWPSQLTNLNEQVSSVRWSPDSKWLVFTSDYGGNERRDLYRVPAGGGAVERLTETKLSETDPRFSPDGTRLAFLADPDGEFQFQLHVLDLATRKVVQLTKDKVQVQKPLWSPDGLTLAVTRTGDDQKGELLLLDAATGALVVVAPPKKGGILWPEAFAPDSKSLLVRARNETGFIQMAVLELKAAGEAGKPPQPAGAPTFFGPGDWDVTETQWNTDGIYYLRNQGGAASLSFLRTPAEKTPIELLPADGWKSSLNLDDSGRRLTLLREDVTRPADVWLVQPRLKPGDSPYALPKQTTFSLMGGVEPGELSRGELVAYESFDKKKIHALVVKPQALRLGSPPPAVVLVHGGPNGQQTLSFSPFVQILAEAGFAVIAPNYRGSTGYGQAFEDANNMDWGGGDLKDLTAAVQFFGARNDIDPKRVAICGGSYGGYLTLMALSKTPDVWKAGVDKYGMPDLVMDYLLTASRFGDWYKTEMGSPRTDAALFRERSPLLYLEDVKAPLLIFQGAGDTNVPRSESDLLAAVLKELKKPHEYIVYDDEGHGFSRRKNKLDFYKRTTAFFVRELKAGK